MLSTEMYGLVISVTLVLLTLVKPKTLREQIMTGFMQVGNLIISPSWFNVLTLFLGVGLFISPSKNIELEKKFLQKGGFVTKRELGMCLSIIVHYSNL